MDVDAAHRPQKIPRERNTPDEGGKRLEVCGWGSEWMKGRAGRMGRENQGKQGPEG